MKSFEFLTANRIIYGNGSLVNLSAILDEYSVPPLLVVGYSHWQDSGILQYSKSFSDIVKIENEPTIDQIREIVNRLMEDPPGVLVALGGGSTIDAAKAIAALLTNQGDVTDYLEVIGQGKVIRNKPVPVIAIPTTAGTGSEVTANAVLGSPKHNLKVSMRSRLMLPPVALIDPVLHHTLPPQVTASTGLDALTQVIEPFVSVFANPFTDMVCREGIQLAWAGLYNAYMDGQNTEARQAMALASLYGGLALANAKLGAVHGIAGPFGGMFNSPHGAVCGKLLPAVIKMNITALQARSPDNKTLDRYRQVAVMITGNSSASPEDGHHAIQDLVKAMKIPGLSTYGFSTNDFSQLIESAKNASSMKGNPILLNTDELEAILWDSFGPSQLD